jgi:hypothetical protein
MPRLRPAPALLVALSPAVGCRSAPPPAFDPLRAALSGEAPWRACLRWPDPALPVHHEVTVEVGPKGAWAAAEPGQAHTDGAAAWAVVGGMKLPLLDLADEGADVYGLLRGGLAAATWSEIEAPALGPIRPAPDAAWAQLRLPFDWADRLTVSLAVDRGDGALRAVLIESEGQPLQVTTQGPRGGPRTVALADGPSLLLPAVPCAP